MLSLIDFISFTLNSSYVIIVLHVLDLISLILIAIKLDNYIHINWILCLLPTVLTEIIKIRLNLLKYLRFNLLSLTPRLIDNIFILLTKILIIYVLLLTTIQYKKMIITFLILIPLIISVVISSFIRLTIVYSKTRYEILNTCCIIIVQVIYKLIQPLVIISRYNCIIMNKWADIFMPMWLLTFLGVGISIIITSCKTLIHPDKSKELREQGLKLVNLSIFQISSYSSCILIFLVWLTQRLDTHKDISYAKIMSPLIVLYLVLIVLDPIVIKASYTYRIYLDAILHQDYQQALLEARSKRAYFEALPNRTYLIQASYNKYNEIPYSIELESKILKYIHLPIIIYDIIDTIEICVQAYATSRENSHHNMLFSNSAASIASILLERKANSIPIGQTYGAEQILYNENLSKSHSSDSHNDIEYIQCSSDENDVHPLVNELGAPEIDVNDVNECIICFQQSPDCVLLTCGHVVMCFNCAVIVSRKVPNQCPICRTPISKLIKQTSPPININDNRTVIVSSEGYQVHNKLAVAYMRIDLQNQSLIHNNNSSNSDEIMNQMTSLSVP